MFLSICEIVLSWSRKNSIEYWWLCTYVIAKPIKYYYESLLTIGLWGVEFCNESFDASEFFIELLDTLGSAILHEIAELLERNTKARGRRHGCRIVLGEGQKRLWGCRHRVDQVRPCLEVPWFESSYASSFEVGLLSWRITAKKE